MVKRLVFALVCFALLFGLFLAGWLEEWGVIIAFVIVVAVTVYLYYRTRGAQNEQRARRLGRFFSPFMRTNNRWWATLLVIVAISALIVIRGGFGPPTLVIDLERETQEVGSDMPSRIADHLYKGTPVDAPRPSQVDVSTYQSWRSFWIRLSLFGILLIAWLVYTFFFAFRDEAVAAVRSVRSRSNTEGESEGDSRWDWLTRWWRNRNAPPSAASVPDAPAQPNSQSGVGQSPGWQLSIGVFIELLERFVERIFIDKTFPRRRL